MNSEHDINLSVQRCTKLFLEAKLHPVSWTVIMNYCIVAARMFASACVELGTQDPPFQTKLITQFLADEECMKSITAWRAAIYNTMMHDLYSKGILISPNSFEFPASLLRQCLCTDPLQNYTAMKCKILDSIDMELCHLLNQIVMDDNLSMESISEEIIVNNIHNPFMDQYDYLYVGTYSQPSAEDQRKRKHGEQAMPVIVYTVPFLRS